MTSLAFDVIDGRAEPYAAVPTLMFRLRVSETTGTEVHAIALRVQIRIEPQRRHYAEAEEGRLVELFGEPARYGDSLKPFLWTHASTTMPGFKGSVEADLPVACTYDFEVAGSKYLHALDDGEIPLVLLFSGTTFSRGPTGVAIEPVSWSAEADYRLPVRVWRDLMDQYFPGGGWLRLSRDSLDALGRFKASRALPSWEQTFEALLKEAGQDT